MEKLEKREGAEFIERNRAINFGPTYRGETRKKANAFQVVQRDNLLNSKHKRTKSQIEKRAKTTSIKRKMQKKSRKRNRKK